MQSLEEIRVLETYAEKSIDLVSGCPETGAYILRQNVDVEINPLFVTALQCVGTTSDAAHAVRCISDLQLLLGAVKTTPVE